jgi:hypothetical protein
VHAERRTIHVNVTAVVVVVVVAVGTIDAVMVAVTAVTAVVHATHIVVRAIILGEEFRRGTSRGRGSRRSAHDGMSVR